MALIARCDNEECKKEMPDTATFQQLALVTEIPTFSMDLSPKQFCSLGCVAHYAAKACGWEVKTDATS